MRRRELTAGRRGVWSGAAGALLAALCLHGGALGSGPGPADQGGGGRAADQIRRDLVMLLQGEPMPVVGAPVLCGTKGVAEGTREWYLGNGKCSLRYEPSPNALVTTASEGLPEPRLASPDFQQRLQALLRELQEAGRRPGFGIQERLLIHSAAWEVAAGLRKRSITIDSRTARQLEPIICEAIEVLRRTAFTTEAIARVPDTLPELASLADVPDIEPTVEALVQHDPGIVEVLPPGGLHADQFLGRFTTRLFLTTESASERAALRSYLRGGPPYGELPELAYRFSGLKGILILYFNVLTPELTIVPTRQVAIWQEYTFESKLVAGMDFKEVAAGLRFRTIKYEGLLSPGAQALRYRQLEARSMARASFLDVVPREPSQPVTTLRGHCLSCHVDQVATFQTHGPRQARFEPPLVRQGRELLTRAHLHNIEPKLQASAQSCPGKDERGRR